jgi:hypothetical protein
MTTPPYPVHAIDTPAPARPNWFSRNWKWVVPVGCFGVVLLGALFACAILSLVFGMMKQSDPYQAAIQRAAASPTVVQQLGNPVSPRWWVSGNIQLNGSSGTADLTIPLSGPRGKATVYVIGQKSAGRWTYSLMEVEVDGVESRVNLLQ